MPEAFVKRFTKSDFGSLSPIAGWAKIGPCAWLSCSFRLPQRPVNTPAVAHA